MASPSNHSVNSTSVNCGNIQPTTGNSRPTTANSPPPTRNSPPPTRNSPPPTRNSPPATQNPEDSHSCPAIFLKWVLAFAIMLAVLSGMMYSTLFTFALAKDLRNGTTTIKDGDKVRPKVQADYVALWLILFLPSVFGFIRAVIKEIFSTGQPWPKWPESVILIAVVSAAEVAGQWLFTFNVLTDDYVDVPTVVVLMNVVLIAHFIQQRTKLYKRALFLHFLGLISIGIGVGIQVYLQKIPSDSALLLTTPLSLVLLSFAWSPYIQLVQMKKHESSQQSEHQDNHTSGNSQTAHVRATMVKNLFNMLLLVIVLFVVPPYIDHHLDGISASSGFSSLYLRRTEAMISVLSAFGGYLLGVIACSMCIQLYSFLIPLTLAPIATVFFAVHMDFCPWFGNDLWCRDGARAVVDNTEYIPVLLVVMGQIFYSIYNYVTTASGIHEKEPNMFWFPQHTGVLTGQHMLLNRTKITENLEESSRSAEGQPQSAEGQPQSAECQPQSAEHPLQTEEDLEQKAKDLGGRVMICTTMYRETWDEMSKYLDSIKRVATSDLDKLVGTKPNNRWAGKFEAHVYFDNGLRGDKLTDFSAQLVCLVKDKYPDSVEVTPRRTWYGWKLRWDLSGSLFLPLTIHLKDNQNVKSKKRWSQVMYMESAVDSQRIKESKKRVKYILATDGDVDFDAGSIVAMLLQMLSDREGQVGAVCARTHPVGSGPFVWYQMFDYAIGHWLQKVANHVLGSVLCAPGCFTVYRVEAIKKVLEEYRSDVEEASDFLTKDMGEDRWFTTLLVKAGYKINYCAGAVDSTHCPEEFDEFWKQRRRWIPSTLANQILLLKNWKDVNKNNKHISMPFLIFQAGLLFSTVVSPSTCILILSGGLYYGVGIPPWLSLVFSILFTLVFAVICIRYSQETQLKLAKILCYIFLLAMLVAVVGTVSQMVLSIHSPKTPIGTGPPTTCFCGSEDDIENGTKLQEDMCAFPCPGDSGEFCGGSAKPGQISVYNINECTREARSQQDQDKDKLSYDIVAKLRQFWT
uniref:chitin synthase n=1 Tax=Branchiostoma floridae TaxID=7739 RepID=C3ZFI9_BRAFL|eukprot:XP_002592732.1 hypothetical protein BRAFLDRAFT_67172 [Branchiostoma floridae]